MAPSCVDLIPEASQAIVLSDVEKGAAGQPGKLTLILAGCGVTDRELPRAMRPWQACLERKSLPPDLCFGAAKLFTEGCGELLGALLALG